jgi:hypothetical protein
MAAGENWTCAYCGHAQVISSERFESSWDKLYVRECEAGDLAFHTVAVVCANNECRRLSLEVAIHQRKDAEGSRFRAGDRINHWRLLPASLAKPQPASVPAVLQADYNEACAIRDLSPKASATLSRRCLQGMIRDFCKISRPKLIQEINDLRDLVNTSKAPPGVQADTMEAIDAVREIGNIGAHMEADINVIVDVDEGEAQALIELIELLFDEWYVAQHQRAEKIKKVGAIASAKAEAKKGNAVETPPGADPIGDTGA